MDEFDYGYIQKGIHVLKGVNFMDDYMKAAIDEAFIGISQKDGGPFGAVIVKDGEIIARGHNKVVSTHDPTAHAEIVAIREAASLLKRFDLSDCELITTCEPCPMCYSAIHWARIGRVVYGATRKDAAEIGFDDNLLYEFLSGKRVDNQLKLEQNSRAACLEVFDMYMKDSDRTPY
jgi:guanine deaminase